MNDWEVSLEYMIDSFTYRLYIYRKLGGRKAEFITKGGAEIVTADLTSALTEDRHFAEFDDEGTLSLMAQALDKRDIKPPKQSYVEGKLEATENHLKDMRKIVFNKRSK